jgi:hypothetical protein
VETWTHLLPFYHGSLNIPRRHHLRSTGLRADLDGVDDHFD